MKKKTVTHLFSAIYGGHNLTPCITATSTGPLCELYLEFFGIFASRPSARHKQIQQELVCLLPLCQIEEEPRTENQRKFKSSIPKNVGIFQYKVIFPFKVLVSMVNVLVFRNYCLKNKSCICWWWISHHFNSHCSVFAIPNGYRIE